MDADEQREKNRLYQIKYRASEKGRAANARYMASEKGRAMVYRKNHSEAGQAAQARYRSGDQCHIRYQTRRQSGELAAYQAEYRRNVRTLHPERMKARAAINYEVRAGRVNRPTVCSACSRQVRTQAHHHAGYDPANWLVVTWLCPRCHKAAH